MDSRLRGLLEDAVGEPPRRVTAEAVRRRVIRRRVMQGVAATVIAAMIPAGIGVLGRSRGPSGNSYSEGRLFVSRHYGYTEAMPADWRFASQATRQWNGKGAPADTSGVVDQFGGPRGVGAWVYAAPTKENLASYTATTIRAAAAAHPCPAVPQTNRAITIGGAPARLLLMHCPPGSGFLVEIAVTIHHGTAFVFASQNRTGTRASDRAAFREFLAGIRLRR